MKNKYRSLTVWLFVLSLFFSCSPSQQKIQGRWLYVKEIRPDGNTTSFNKKDEEVIEFTKRGEIKLYHNDKRYGLGSSYYRLQDDSLHIATVQYDTFGKADTLQKTVNAFSVKGDTLYIHSNGSIIIYSKVKR